LPYQPILVIFAPVLRKSLSILFALLLLFNSMGLFVAYFAAMEESKMEAMDYIQTHHNFSSRLMVNFYEGSNNFRLLNKDEIISSGKLYDIVKQEKVNNRVVYSAISDEKEDIFWQGISQLAKNNSDSRRSSEKAFTQISLKFVGGERTLLPGNFSGRITVSFYSAQTIFLYQSPFGDIFSPPPQVINA
jgi:hypothetical protein